MSSVYTVRYAPQALDDLRDLYSYVALSLKEPATAQNWSTASARLLAHWMPCPGGTLLWTGNRGRAWGCTGLPWRIFCCST